LRQAAYSKSRGEGFGESVDVEPYQQRFTEAMDDDFNAPQALATLFDLARDINRAIESGLEAVAAQKVLLELNHLLTPSPSFSF